MASKGQAKGTTGRACFNHYAIEPGCPACMRNAAGALLESRYADAQKDARNLLGLIAGALDGHKATSETAGRNWGHVGDLGHVAELLGEIRGFLTPAA